MEEAKKATRKILNQTQLFELGDYLRKHCTSVNGFALYETGYDDQKVADELKCTIHNVKGLRTALIGPLAGKQQPLTNLNLLHRLEALEAWAMARPVAKFVKEN